jgi:catechol 2,3-dioxygenase-like lactoylglutathione lyase family enzyme
MIDHIELTVADYGASRAFYAEALRPLGIERVMEVAPKQGATGWACGFGSDGKPFFWIGEGAAVDHGCHVAFAAATRAEVDAFHAAALAAGARDNGSPGLRPQYHANYYGAFVRDLNGWNLEAVCHAPA